jgi:ribonuclease BN (tRNA processing enzyme)
MQPLAKNGPLSFIGTGSAFNHNLGNNSAYLKRNSTLLLIDCGGTVFHRIQNLNLLQDVERLYVVITHMHPDHVGSLGDLIFYTYYMMKLKTTVIYPDLDSLAELLTALGVTKEFYTTENIENDLLLKNADMEVKLECIPQEHTSTLNSYGYLIELDNLILFYSGDSKSIPEIILHKLYNNEIAFLYQDTCSYDAPNIPHLSLNKLSQIIDENLRRKVYCMHLDNAFDETKAKSIGFNVVQLS